METNEDIKQQILFFKENNIKVHIEKNNTRFYNGLILEFQGDMLILDDEVLGAIPIFISEIKFIEKRKDKNE
jgi:hypothetical protein